MDPYFSRSSGGMTGARVAGRGCFRHKKKQKVPDDVERLGGDGGDISEKFNLMN